MASSRFVLGWVFEVGKSNGTILGSLKYKTMAGGHFEKSNGHISARHYPIQFMYV